MGKLKTHSGTKKRFRRTASGRYKHKKANARHLLTKKASARMRKLRRAGLVDEADAGQIRRLLPYG